MPLINIFIKLRSCYIARVLVYPMCFVAFILGTTSIFKVVAHANDGLKFQGSRNSNYNAKITMNSGYVQVKQLATGESAICLNDESYIMLRKNEFINAFMLSTDKRRMVFLIDQFIGENDAISYSRIVGVAMGEIGPSFISAVDSASLKSKFGKRVLVQDLIDVNDYPLVKVYVGYQPLTSNENGNYPVQYYNEIWDLLNMEVVESKQDE